MSRNRNLSLTRKGEDKKIYLHQNEETKMIIDGDDTIGPQVSSSLPTNLEQIPGTLTIDEENEIISHSLPTDANKYPAENHSEDIHGSLTIDEENEIISHSLLTDANKSPAENQSEDIYGSQDLFAENKMEEDVRNPSCETSTPFNDAAKTTTHFNSLQLSGVESSSSDSNLSHPTKHSQPQVLSSPTAVGKLEYSTPEKGIEVASEKASETLDIPLWCKNVESKNSSSSSSNVDIPGNVMDETDISSNERNQIMGEREMNYNRKLSSSSNKVSFDSASGSLESCSSNAFSLLSGADILKPAHSQVSMKSNYGTQGNESGESIYDIIPPMNFEFSQDFSYSEKSYESFTSIQSKNTSKEEGMKSVLSQSNENSNLNIKTKGDELESLDKMGCDDSTTLKEVQPSCSKEIHDMNTGSKINNLKSNEVSCCLPANDVVKPSCSIDTDDSNTGIIVDGSKKLNAIESYIPAANGSVILKESHSSYSKEISDLSVENKINNVVNSLDKIDCQESATEIKEGAFVFGLWDKIYYPGVVKSFDKSTVIIHFHDNHIMAMPREHLFMQQLFPYGQEICVKSEDEYYHNAVIMSSFRHRSDVFHVVELNDEFKIVNRNFTCFTQLQCSKLLINNAKNELTNHSKSTDICEKIVNPRLSSSHKRRRTEPLSIGKSSIFPSPSRKYIKYVPEQLFHGLTFFILAEDLPNLCKMHDNDNHDIEKEEDIPLAKSAKLQKLIEQNGGIIMPKLYGRDLQQDSKIVCISNDVCASLQFIYCVVVGIPILRIDWVYKSVELNNLEPYESYVLPAGKDITGQVVEQNYSAREPYTPLNPLRIYVHTEGEIKYQNRLLDLLLHTAGCERLFSCTYVTKKTKKVPFNINSVDYILTMVDHVPHALLEAADKYDKSIVTSTWLFQCLLNNQLLDATDCPIFRYSKLSDSG